MLNVALVHEHFQLANGKLFRRLIDGTAKPVTLVKDGRLASRLGGVEYYGPAVAWALYYSSAPMFPVICVDGDPFNLSQENVVPVRRQRVRFRLRTGYRGFSHQLASNLWFRTEVACRDHWVGMARAHYMEDFELARQLEDERDRQMPAAPYSRTRRAFKPLPARGLPASERPPKPPADAGRRWYWYAEQWVSVPEAVHASDDYIERCRHVLAGAKSFVYDPEKQMTVPVF